MANQVDLFQIESIRGDSQTSTVAIQRGQYVCSVSVDGCEVLSRIKGKPWTVADDAEPWQLADAAKALCLN